MKMVKRTKLVLVSIIVALLLALASSAVVSDCWATLETGESAAPAVMEIAGRFTGGGTN
jgi:hypothetical protein